RRRGSESGRGKSRALRMRETVIALLVFVSLMAASFVSQAVYRKLSARRFNEDTHAVIRHIASLFVGLAALVLGLATNSARDTLQSVDHNIHSFATQLILLDRTLQLHGPEANEARQRLLRYTQHAATTLGDASPNASDQTAEGLLNDVGASLNAIRPDRAD